MQTEYDSSSSLPAPAGATVPQRTDDVPDVPPQRIGRPGPAHARSPFLVSELTDTAYPVVAGAAPDEHAETGRQRRSPRRMIVPLLIVALVGSIGWQAWRLDRLDDRLGDTDRRLSAALAAERSRAAQADARTADLERGAQRAFNPEAIAAAVLPSVFRVRAGRFTGTAFAVGDKAAGGTTNLLTNYHVVASVWEAGNRKVVLERGEVEVSATLVDVDVDEDLALLRTERDAAGAATAGLTTAVDASKSGQPVVVVGSPLGMEDSVTTGVISAVRADDRGRRIQFDAAINPGNSGGPVVNSAKQVVGLATAKARGAEGIALAVPIEIACDAFKVC